MAASRAAAAAASAGVAAAAAAYHFRDDAPPLHSALQPGRQLVCPLVAKTPLTPDTSRYRFALPTPAHSLGLPVASHVLAVDAGNMYREYTPVTLDGVDVGYFDLVVKRYANGYFSERFARLEPGQTMRFSGPVVTLPYAANAADRVAMVAGGTGITPMLQIARASLRDDGDATKFALLYANRTPGDILLRAELDALAAAHPDRFSVRYVADESDGRWTPTPPSR
ncbi:cytochrome-b5 reductase [Aureococcus anophagefferens]|nr:cytochrome-b5 reductase [Aureococcus anophagefferens]